MNTLRNALCLVAAFLVACEEAPETESSVEVTPVDVSAEEAAELLEKDSEIVVVDVRTPAEYAEGHIEGAKNIDYNGENFGEEIAALEPGKTYLVHCAAGGRSAKSLPEFEKLDVEKIYHLAPGFNGWKDAGLPVEE